MGDAWVERQRILRVLRLCGADPTVYDASRNLNGSFVEIDVRPLQSQNFRNAQAHALGQENHGPIRLGELRQNGVKLLDGEDRRHLSSFGGSLDLHKFQRISLNRQKLPEHGFLEKPSQEASDMRLRFRRQCKAVQPSLYRRGANGAQFRGAPRGTKMSIDQR